jgi:hypothetical protein
MTGLLLTLAMIGQCGPSGCYLPRSTPAVASFDWTVRPVSFDRADPIATPIRRYEWLVGRSADGSPRRVWGWTRSNGQIAFHESEQPAEPTPATRISRPTDAGSTLPQGPESIERPPTANIEPPKPSTDPKPAEPEPGPPATGAAIATEDGSKNYGLMMNHLGANTIQGYTTNLPPSEFKPPSRNDPPAPPVTPTDPIIETNWIIVVGMVGVSILAMIVAATLFLRARR